MNRSDEGPVPHQAFDLQVSITPIGFRQGEFTFQNGQFKVAVTGGTAFESLLCEGQQLEPTLMGMIRNVLGKMTRQG